MSRQLVNAENQGIFPIVLGGYIAGHIYIIASECDGSTVDGCSHLVIPWKRKPNDPLEE
jgi:hypothetical protein